MTNAKYWLIGGVFIALMAFQATPVSAQRFPGFSKKLGDYQLSKKSTVIVYRDTRGKTRVGVTRGKKLTALKVKFSPSTKFSNFTLIGDSLFFIAEDKAWAVKYFWNMDNGALKFAATNAARKKTVFSKGMKKTSIAYVFLRTPSAREWWVAQRRGTHDEITGEDLRYYSFNFGAAVVDRRTVLVAFRVTSSRIPLGLKNAQGFLYRLRGREWKPKRIKLDGLPRSAPDLNGDGSNEVVMFSISNYRNKSWESSKLIWWDKKAAKLMNSGIEAKEQFGFNAGDDEGEEFEMSTLHFNLAAKPYPLIIVKGERKKYNEEEEITILGSIERRYQWKPAKRAFMRIK